MAMTCKNCGASLQDGRLTCQYCGTATRVGMTEEEELQALEEVRVCLERVMDDDEYEDEEELSIWKSAYIPQYWGPAVRAFGMALQCVVDEGPSSRAALARAEGIYNTAILANMTNPAAIAAAPLMKESLEGKRAIIAESDRRAADENKHEWTVLIWLFVALFGGLAAMVYAIAKYD